MRATRNDARRAASGEAGHGRSRSGVSCCYCFFFQAEDGIRDYKVTGLQTCALPIFEPHGPVRVHPVAQPGGLGHILEVEVAHVLEELEVAPLVDQHVLQTVVIEVTPYGTHRHAFTGAVHVGDGTFVDTARAAGLADARSEEHTSELQSPCNIVWRLLLEKKKTDSAAIL